MEIVRTHHTRITAGEIAAAIAAASSDDQATLFMLLAFEIHRTMPGIRWGTQCIAIQRSDCWDEYARGMFISQLEELLDFLKNPAKKDTL